MTFEQKFKKIETPLIIFGILLSSILRLYHLGSQPLSDYEARLANEALTISKGLFGPASSNAFYTSLTSLFFLIFTSSNFFARLLPAIAGISLTISPIFFKKWLGNIGSFCLLIFLAIDPSLVYMSRSINQEILPLTILVLLAASIINGRFSISGVLAGLFLLSGPQLYLVVIGLAISFIVLYFRIGSDPFKEYLSGLSKDSLRSVVYPLVLTYVFVGSKGLMNPTGLGSVVASFSQFAGSWLKTGGVDFTRISFTLLAYEGFATILFLLGIKNLIERQDVWMSGIGIFTFIVTFMAILNPSRLTTDIVWAIPFIAIVGAMFIADSIEDFGEVNREILGMFIFTFVLLVFIALNYLSIALVVADPATLQMRWIVLIGSLLLLLVSLLLITFGWSYNTASKGLGAGLILFLFILNLANIVFSAGLRAEPTNELWQGSDQVNTDGVLTRQLKEVALWNNDALELQNLTIVGVNSPALEWALRNYHVEVLQQIPGVDELGPIIITPDAFQNDGLNANYRGQNIIWSSQIPYQALTQTDWMRWSVNHTFPLAETKLILWIKADKFIDSQNNQ